MTTQIYDYYEEWRDEDDEGACLAHQQELECEEWEEYETEYNAWLASQEPWWRLLDNDPNWIKEHS